MSQDPTAAQLTAEARHAATRVTLYRQRLYAGTVDGRRLPELERIAANAADRLATHRAGTTAPAAAPQQMGLATALRDVSDRLDDPSLADRERLRLLQRQAELGDLRDELALRERRRHVVAHSPRR